MKNLGSKKLLCRVAVLFFIVLGFNNNTPLQAKEPRQEKIGDSKTNAVKTNHAKPNIVLINADDLGYGDLGCYGATKVKTPNIDKLAKAGRMFTDAHSSSAVCSPSRYGLLTGQYPFRQNMWAPTPYSNKLLIDTKRLTIARLLKQAGYSTACVGKWHLGFGNKRTDWNAPLKPGPLEIGFDYYFGIPSVNSGPPFVYVENYRPVKWDPTDPFVKNKKSVTEVWPGKGGYNKIGGAKQAHLLYRDEKVGTTLKNKAIAWMKKTHQKNTKKPFFLYLATTNIHHPFTPAPQFKGSSQCGRYGDFIHELDAIVGELLATLDALKIADNTLVIFTSDNGGMLNVGGQDAWKAGHRLNGKLQGFKFGAWEGGHRIPMIARWPGKIPAGTKSNHLLSQLDFLATFAAVTGQPLKKKESADSLNQWATFTGNPKKPIRQQLIISPRKETHLLIRTKKWAYIPAQNEGGFGFRGAKVGEHAFAGAASMPFTGNVNSDVVNGKVLPNAPLVQLYDLEKDLRQTKNVSRQHPKIVKELQQQLDAARKTIKKKTEKKK